MAYCREESKGWSVDMKCAYPPLPRPLPLAIRTLWGTKCKADMSDVSLSRGSAFVVVDFGAASSWSPLPRPVAWGWLKPPRPRNFTIEDLASCWWLLVWFALPSCTTSMRSPADESPLVRPWGEEVELIVLERLLRAGRNMLFLRSIPSLIMKKS